MHLTPSIELLTFSRCYLTHPHLSTMTLSKNFSQSSIFSIHILFLGNIPACVAHLGAREWSVFCIFVLAHFLLFSYANTRND